MYKNEINKNNNIRNIIIVSIVLIIYSILTKDHTIYLLLNSVITVAMIIVFIYVNIIRTEFVDKTFMKSFELQYLMLILIIILNIIGFIALFKFTPRIDFVFLFSVQATLECCLIDNFLKFKRNYLKSIMICIIYFILFVMLFYIFKVNKTLSSDYKSYIYI